MEGKRGRKMGFGVFMKTEKVREKRRREEGEMEELCALCGKRARIYCESDQAKLCWDCDNKVHGANFLVAKHTRVLLCRACHSSTPWKACGPKLTPTHSLCLPCTTTNSHKEEEQEDDDDDDNRDDRPDFDHDDDGDSRSDSDSDSDLGSDGDADGESDEEGENQVVPWSSASLPSPDHASSASSAWNRRVRGNSFVDSDEEILCSSSEIPSAAQLASDDSSSWSNFRPWKHPRTTQRLVEDATRFAENC